MPNINASGFGTSARITASGTFPQGFTVTQFADDADSLDFPELQVADSGMGLNGDHVVWSRPVVMEIALNVIPNTDDDRNLEILFDANRLEKFKSIANDEIGIVITYPDGSTANLASGICLAYTPSRGVSQAGRQKTRSYRFRVTALSRTRVE